MVFCGQLGETMLDLSVVVVTYNRSALLAQNVRSLQSKLAGAGLRYELVIADDCSDFEHRCVIDSISSARVVRTLENSGLGANANNGLRAVSGDYILQLQDDWDCIDATPIVESLGLMKRHRHLGVVQLTEVGSDLPTERLRTENCSFLVFANDQLPWMRRCGVRPYSDCPHIKRRSFVESVGPYLEAVPMTRCENDYKRRVARQRRWRVAQVEGAKSFVHLGASVSLNPGGRRHPLIAALHRLPYGERFLDPMIRLLARRIDHMAAMLIWRLRSGA